MAFRFNLALITFLALFLLSPLSHGMDQNLRELERRACNCSDYFVKAKYIDALVKSGNVEKLKEFVFSEDLPKISIRTIQNVRSLMQNEAPQEGKHLSPLATSFVSPSLYRAKKEPHPEFLRNNSGLVHAQFKMCDRGGRRGEIELWDGVSGSYLGVQKFCSDAQQIHVFRRSPDWRWFFLAVRPEPMEVNELQRFGQVYKLPEATEFGAPIQETNISAAAFSKDGSKLAMISGHHLFYYTQGTESFEFKGQIDHPFFAQSVTLCFVGKDRLLSGSSGANAYLWDLKTNSILETFRPHQDYPLNNPQYVDIEVSEDLQHWIGRRHSGEVLLWDLNSSRLVRSLHFYNSRKVGFLSNKWIYILEKNCLGFVDIELLSERNRSHFRFHKLSVAGISNPTWATLTPDYSSLVIDSEYPEFLELLKHFRE